MVKLREPFVITRPARVVLGLSLALGLGAAVAASPVRSVPAAPVSKAVMMQTSFRPLGEGVGVSVQKSFGRADEDCVTVTQVKGADGRIYAARGMVCRE